MPDSQPSHQDSGTVNSSPPGFDDLRKAREAAGLSLSDVADSLGIRPQYLEALERGELDREIDSPHARGMLAQYAERLGLDPAPYMARPPEPREPSLAQPDAAQSDGVEPTETLRADAGLAIPGEPSVAEPSAEPSLLRRVLVTLLVIGIGACVVLAGFVLALVLNR